MLMAEVERRRRAEGLSMREFSRALGVSVVLYSETVRGRKPVRRKLASAIVQRYRDLRPLALREAEAYLVGERQS